LNICPRNWWLPLGRVFQFANQNMPIRINLLAETMAAEELRRSDPIKRVIVLGVLFIVAMLIWYGYLSVKKVFDERDLVRVETQISLHTNEYVTAVNTLSEIGDTQAHLDALNKLNTNRFLQGTLLNALQQVTVPGVQLTRLSLAQTYSAGPSKGPGKPATTLEQITLTLDIKDSSPNPGDGVNKFKDALVLQPYLQSALDTNGIRLSGLNGVQTSPDGKAFEIFTLECRFPDKAR
jgi:hypothetical protein